MPYIITDYNDCFFDNILENIQSTIIVLYNNLDSLKTIFQENFNNFVFINKNVLNDTIYTLCLLDKMEKLNIS